MAFSVVYNPQASNTLRNLNITSQKMNNLSAQLSSGLRINKAADDAAGLAISQKMLAQINGLNQATQNAQDAISLIQTAEGALGQQQDILQRMRTLAVQAANDTATTSDRAQIQKEMDQLAQELTQISNTTQFNTQKLLTGQYSATGLTFQVGANAGENMQVTLAAADAKSLGVTRDMVDTASAGTTSSDGTVFTGSTAVVSNLTVSSSDGYALTAGTGAYQVVYSATASGTGPYTLSGQALQLQDGSGNNIGNAVDVSAGAGDYVVGDAATGQAIHLHFSGEPAASAAGSGNVTTTVNTSASSPSASGSAANGWKATVSGGISIMTQSSADAAVTTIQNAIDTISGYRDNLGAVQNRLNYIINNLTNSSQNLSDAKSQITDTDMAATMSQFQQNLVLQQAGISVLAQANQLPGLIMKLLP
ncbi:MAG: flagellin [Firmicutes bacterium]|nr:flagellin [Bacillota bacterium]